MDKVGSFFWIKGLRYEPDLSLSHNIPFWHAQGEFYLYDALEITLPIACREN